jgi:hypothetical protein
MPTSPPRLSKFHFLAHQQCPRRLHLATHARELATPRSAGLQAILDQGRAIGLAAHALFPGGIPVEETDFAEALVRTRALIEDADVPAIFEAAFEYEGVRIRTDVLVRLPLGRFALCEVKSATKWKQEHGPDLAVQLWVLRGCEVPVAACELIHVDKSYVRGDGSIRPERFFMREDRSAAIESLVAQVDDWLRELQRVLASPDPPDVEPGTHCRSPHPCEFWAHCTAGRNDEWFLQQKRVRYEVRRRWLSAVERGEPWISTGLAEALISAEPPAWYLDFEALGPAIPIHEGVRPYEAIAFQWSLHRLEADGTTRHLELLADGHADPRDAVAEGLLEALCGDDDPIVVYGDYESRMLRDMAEHAPALAGDLCALDARLVDLLPIVRAHIYDGAFRGSFSLKAVAPALAPHVRYDDLDGIADGTAAAAAFAQLAGGEPDTHEEETVRDQLLAYCERDTLALMETHRALRNAAGIEALVAARAARDVRNQDPGEDRVVPDEAEHLAEATARVEETGQKPEATARGEETEPQPEASAPAHEEERSSTAPDERERPRDATASVAERERLLEATALVERERLLEATALAYEWHAGQTRKQSDIPYVSHPLQVMGLVLEHHGDADQAIAALLHDALEDATDPAERRQRETHIKRRFGRGVLDMVLHCTDTLDNEAGEMKGPWRERKERYLSQLRRESDRSLLVAACDKRHNLHALVWDIEIRGVEYLSAFNAGAEDQVWYFEEILTTVRGRVPERLFRELQALVEQLRELLKPE